MAYSYGPPPPTPPPAAPNNGQGGYAPSYGHQYPQVPQRGGHGGRGRGGPDRGGYHPGPTYNYGQQQPVPYGQPNPAPYPGPHPPPQTAYSSQQQQQWHSEQQPQQHPSQAPPHAPLPAQNYHPNYAPQMYHQQQQQPQPQPYNGQPPYQPAPQPHYGPSYPAPAQPGPPAQQWGGHAQNPPNQGPYGGGGRGGRGYNDRGGPKGQMMGPPIRIGFDGNGSQSPAAPVSSPYPPQPYGGPQGPAAPYPSAPYQAYAPAPAPYMPVPAPYDAHHGHNPRHHNRGGFHNNAAKSRPQFGGDKVRNRNSRGGPAAQTPPTHHQKPDGASAGKKKKRKTNTLGLTPGDESDEDDENEEERLNEMYGADAPDPPDIAAWIAERRAHFPTKARVEALKAAAAARAQNGDANRNSEARDALLEQKAEKLRKQLEKVESSIKRKREQQDEGDDMRDINLTSSPSVDSKSDDEKPEVMSTRPEPSNLPPPPKKADPSKHCKYFSTGGTCGKRGKCRFVHDPAVREAALKEREENGGRMTLKQRLILNDKEQEDLTIVQTLKYLQDKGLIKKDLAASSSSGAAASNAQHERTPTSLPAASIKKEPGTNHGLPPIPPPSVVPPTVVSHGQTSKYPGWNLSGFGNTGVRSGDI
ncbi:hypothetical protein B0H67DRAFT_548614 [Lasiosphaeris hirsuta]|uniref:C3H1-type domain-containing protein n=1 Tax=Lasiosphaeris hirsuta TaxID=260670 RepID=A0AA40EB26_9PEZI|nr:hypothetical protein B0H67DRAFT_548614 [Lasiosphaeris hirsuta]